MNQLEEHDLMIRKSERILLLKTILSTLDNLYNVEQVKFYVKGKLENESNVDKKVVIGR